MKVLKFTVIAMGILILASIIIIFTTIAKRLDSPFAGNSSVSDPKNLKTFKTEILLPKGAVIRSTTVEHKRIILDLLWPDGIEGVILIDSNTGRQIGVIRFRKSEK